MESGFKPGLSRERWTGPSNSPVNRPLCFLLWLLKDKARVMDKGGTAFFWRCLRRIWARTMRAPAPRPSFRFRSRIQAMLLSRASHLSQQRLGDPPSWKFAFAIPVLRQAPNLPSLQAAAAPICTGPGGACFPAPVPTLPKKAVFLRSVSAPPPDFRLLSDMPNLPGVRKPESVVLLLHGARCVAARVSFYLFTHRV